jgi:hypothetical protein
VSVIEIVRERMERFFRDPVNYDGPFSGITYGQDTVDQDPPDDDEIPDEDDTLPCQQNF